MTGPWWESFYDDTFADVVMATGADEVAEATVAFLVDKLALQPGDTVFDQCCGIGRLSIPLARRQFHVIGVDVIEPYIRRATAAAAAHGLACEFHAADAFDFVPPISCDGALNWWTSFGYTDDGARNQQMLSRAFEALKSGGRFALDYYNVLRLLREFQDRIRIRYATEQGEAFVTRDTQVSFERGMLEQRWSYEAPDGAEHTKTSATKLSMPHELRAMLLRCGFVDVELYGGVDGTPFTISSPRCVLVARKPE